MSKAWPHSRAIKSFSLRVSYRCQYFLKLPMGNWDLNCYSQFLPWEQVGFCWHDYRVTWPFLLPF